jgi:hypothetical protein
METGRSPVSKEDISHVSREALAVGVLLFLSAQRIPPDSSFEAVCAEGAVREVSASTHTHASGVFASPVDTQAQVR